MVTEPVPCGLELWPGLCYHTAAGYGLVRAGAPRGKLIGGEWLGQKRDLLGRCDPFDGSPGSALSSKGTCVPCILSLGHLDVFTLGDQSLLLQV